MLILKFSAGWCQPCKKLVPIFENVKKLFQNIEFNEVDIDTNPDLALQFKIMSVPTLVFIKDGVEIGRIVGLVREQDIINKVDDLK